MEVSRRVCKLLTADGRITADGNAIALLEAGLDRETFLDVIEAILTIQHDPKIELP